MKKKKNNVWMIAGVIIAILLLLSWLFSVTILEEDQNVIPILDGTEQVVP